MKQTTSSTVNFNNKFCPHCSQECNNLSDDIKSLLLPISENGNDPEKINSSKYYDIDEMHNIEMPHENKPLSLFHINACSLNKHFDNLQHLLSCTKKN